MTQSRWPFVVAVGGFASLCGLLAGFNLHWSREASFPLHGLIIDVCAVPVLIYIFVYVRRLKAASTDEFAVTKKRFAAQTGFVFGFVLFGLSGVFPLVFPGAYHAFIGSLDGAHEGFIMGRVLGMAPFVIGLLIGQIAAWMRYR